MSLRHLPKHSSRIASKNLCQKTIVTSSLAAALAPWVGAVQGVEFAATEIFFEENTTDWDLSIQISFDGPGWKEVSVYAPAGPNDDCSDPEDGERVFYVENGGGPLDVAAGDPPTVIGSAEKFIESAEPPDNVVTRNDWFTLFPAGTYCFMGTTVDGEDLKGEAELTHNIPVGPLITSPEDGAQFNANKNLNVQWDLVPDPLGSVVTGYQLVVKGGEPLRVFSVELPPTASSFTVDKQEFERGMAYKVELIVTELSGDRAISEIEVETKEN
jgi:hypothetical protein